MFRNLLVPLDGSTLAETAVPWALWLAERFGSRVTLMHVIERHAPKTVHGDQHLSDPAAADDYLKALLANFPREIRVEGHVHTAAQGNVAASIADHTEELGADLVILSAHGKPGTRGMLLGGIAQQVLRQADVPVLLLRPGTPSAQRPAADGVLVPLNGTPEAEAVLPLATEVARSTGGVLRLLMVVPTVGTLRGDRAATALVSPLATAAVLDIEQANAVQYIEEIVEKVQVQGVKAVAEVERGDVARLVANVAKRPEVDLVAIASHGRAGFAALWSSSVGASVQAQVDKPMLLLNPGQPPPPRDGSSKTE